MTPVCMTKIPACSEDREVWSKLQTSLFGLLSFSLLRLDLLFGSWTVVTYSQRVVPFDQLVGESTRIIITGIVTEMTG